MTRLAVFALAVTVPLAADTSTSVSRGRKALLENNYIPPGWSREAYDQAWKRWEGVAAKPADYAAAFRDVYGLHPAPYANGDLPMGLREGFRLFGRGVGIDCMACHGGSILGT